MSSSITIKVHRGRRYLAPAPNLPSDTKEYREALRKMEQISRAHGLEMFYTKHGKPYVYLKRGFDEKVLERFDIVGSQKDLFG